MDNYEWLGLALAKEGELTEIRHETKRCIASDRHRIHIAKGGTDRVGGPNIPITFYENLKYSPIEVEDWLAAPDYKGKKVLEHFWEGITVNKQYMDEAMSGIEGEVFMGVSEPVSEAGHVVLHITGAEDTRVAFVGTILRDDVKKP